MFCSKCGTSLPEGATYCSACGQPVGGVGFVPAPTPVSAPVAASVSAAGFPGAATSVSTTAIRPVPAVAYAGFWLRFVALIIDAIILGVAGTIISMPFMASIGLREMFARQMMRPEDFIPLIGMFFRLALIRACLSWLYYALLESSSWQATLGKKALGLEVTDMYGRRISFGRATGRFFGKIISAIILYIGFFMAGFTEKKQALHDMMAGCLVIKKV